MTVVVISRCKNEADIVEPWVRHTLAHVDRIVVSDNDSVDDTPAILEALKAEGLPITILHEQTIGDYQSRVFTRMMRDMVSSAASTTSWVVPLDTDEFIETDEGIDEISGATIVAPRYADLLARGPAVVRSLRWHSMAWTRHDDQRELNPVVRMGQRVVDETYYQKISVPRALVATSELCTGSHFLLPSGDNGQPVKGARICHFPLRSVDQYRMRSAMAYLQSLCVPGWDRKTGFQFSSLPDVRRIEETALEDYSRRYASQRPPDWRAQTVHAPLDYRGGPLRYTKAEERFIQVVLAQAEKMALGIAERDAVDADGRRRDR